jgi:hypothetical protein
LFSAQSPSDDALLADTLASIKDAIKEPQNVQMPSTIAESVSVTLYDYSDNL